MRSVIRTPASIIGNAPIPKLPAFVVDVDGTVAIRTDRGPYQFDLAMYDIPNRPVVDLVNMIAEWSMFKIIFVTGRQETYRQITHQWLHMHVTLFDLLLMRKTGDNRPDWEVKRDIYERDIYPTFDVKGVFDDRQQVVDMWRRFGLTCYQVAPGNF